MSGPLLPEPSGREPSAAELATATDPRLGIAYAVNVRNEGGGENSVAQVILTYRIHRLAPGGGTLPALQVEMRGRRLQGMVADGDLIQAPTPLPPAGVVQLESVTNLTTSSPVVLSRARASGCAVAALVVVLAFAVIFVGFILVSLLTSG
jgi:hypothetical protein